MVRLIPILILAFGPMSSLCHDAPIVETPLGSVLGTVQVSRKGMDFYSFRGIRYAESPEKNLRFKPPVPVKPWTGRFDATKDGPACMQKFWRNMSEDCLRLNVYTHHINDEQIRPVLVYIHESLFEKFTSQSDWLGPEYLMDHDIVVVTMNYRLGTFGFFSTGDEHAPGNYGMKDQVEALRWVQNNIRAFGGDANKVTIAGQNAGAASVILHMLSPMSAGLFHGAIALSASAYNNWTITRKPLHLAQRQAALLNCPTDNSQAMVDCLRELPAKDISDIFYNIREEYRGEPYGTVAPVIESGNDDSERFLSRDPLALLKEGSYANVPLMIGTTRDEMSYLAFSLMFNEEDVSELSTNWNKVAPTIFYYEPNDAISEQIREFYLQSLDKPITNDSLDGLAQLYSDSLSIFGVIQTAKLVSGKNSSPVYLYQYNYERQGLHHRTDIPDYVAHGRDLEMIFKSHFRPLTNDSVEDALVVDKLTMLWKNFVETGDPTPASMDILDNVKWLPFKSTSPNYLGIKSSLICVGGLYYEDRMSFWEKLFPL